MKYIRTYETEEKFLTDKDSTSRVFRLKPTLYKYSEAGDHVHLELDDPRKHEGSTWIRLEFTKATTFSFKIGNVAGDSYNGLKYTIDWGDGTVEMDTVVQGTDGLYTFTHYYKPGIYDIELYGTDRDYMVIGKTTSSYKSYFSPVTAVKRILLGEKVTSIGDWAFMNCSSLTSINLPSTLTSIGNNVFSGCSSLTSIDIPEGVTSIGNNVFSGCSSLTSIDIPEGVTSIGNNVFSGCSSLTSINLPSTLTSIDNSAFFNCSKLTSINLPSSLVSIGNYMFNYCSSLSSITIPESVTSIGDGAFYNCSSLTSINVLASTPPALGIDVFSQHVLINIPENSLTWYASSDWVRYIRYKIVGFEYNDLLYYLTENNTAIVYDYNHDSSISSTVIPSSIQHESITYNVTSISSYAFQNCSSLTSITIPESVTSIGNWVFQGCTSLTSINLPSTLTSISSHAFQDCSSLTSITIPEGVTSIGNWVFQGCTSLTSINLPSTLTSIGDYTFWNCSSLTSITIPEGVTSIRGVFTYCSKLTSIYSYNTNAPTLVGSSEFSNVSTSGTLHIKPGATGYDKWLKSLPSGWTIVEDL